MAHNEWRVSMSASGHFTRSSAGEGLCFCRMQRQLGMRRDIITNLNTYLRSHCKATITVDLNLV